MIIQISRTDPKLCCNMIRCNCTFAALIKKLQTNLQNSFNVCMTFLNNRKSLINATLFLQQRNVLNV
ncbi:unnamed protein product [Oppiella nova]|uniref:Uncharacterized protein n=1 Tax=Oppiella nova TaxID=334625 RepID=A0A7R9Q8C4_9ACAR|nr:unnamed protein product [Oppiella nova]CAG2155691.1 unnamed protein product [Oppiella nova]